ncbi:hypothetical protein DL93DRAFT_1570218 [Clavulina sp. PMI_390]|nr:hypothetical protein DL93DRAFT_1570218 [Clavulina sp. PMI_390]
MVVARIERTISFELVRLKHSHDDPQSGPENLARMCATLRVIPLRFLISHKNIIGRTIKWLSTMNSIMDVNADRLRLLTISRRYLPDPPHGSCVFISQTIEGLQSSSSVSHFNTLYRDRKVYGSAHHVFIVRQVDDVEERFSAPGPFAPPLLSFPSLFSPSLRATKMAIFTAILGGFLGLLLVFHLISYRKKVDLTFISPEDIILAQDRE